MKTSVLAFGLVAATALTSPAHADKLDDIIASGTLRCAVVLDFPPMGSRDENNEPIGFDVDYCNDLATALGVTAEIVETPFPERIPALMSGRVDVGVASTSDTLERAKTVGMTVPYFAFEMAVTANEKSGIKSFEDMKGKVVGATAGTYEAIALENQVKAWGEGEFRPYQTQADVFLALSQGQLDATVSTSTVAQSNVKGGKFPVSPWSTRRPSTSTTWPSSLTARNTASSTTSTCSSISRSAPAAMPNSTRSGSVARLRPWR